MLFDVHSVFSTQNPQQRALGERFSRLARASAPAVRVHAQELKDLPRAEGTEDSFGRDGWYQALVLKVTHWARLAEAHPGQLMLCSDNDVSLLPGWLEALTLAFENAGTNLDLCFQREGGDDPFFAPFPYNSGLFLMRGSDRAARFWREVAARTEAERPFTGDQAVVNALLMGKDAAGMPRCAAPLGLRHAHFPPRLVRGGPSVPSRTEELSEARAHHATASGSAEGKLNALDAFLDAWLQAHNRTRGDVGLASYSTWEGWLSDDSRGTGSEVGIPRFQEASSAGGVK